MLLPHDLFGLGKPNLNSNSYSFPKLLHKNTRTDQITPDDSSSLRKHNKFSNPSDSVPSNLPSQHKGGSPSIQGLYNYATDVGTRKPADLAAIAYYFDAARLGMYVHTHRRVYVRSILFGTTINGVFAFRFLFALFSFAFYRSPEEKKLERSCDSRRDSVWSSG